MSILTDPDHSSILGKPKGNKANPSDIPFPIPVPGDLSYSIRATLVSSARAVVTDPEQIVLLQRKGYYGYLPEKELPALFQFSELDRPVDTDDEEYDPTFEEFSSPPQLSDEPSEHQTMYLMDTEILFLLFGLGCLKISFPELTSEHSENFPKLLQLWSHLCTGTCQPSDCRLPSTARSESSEFCRRELNLLQRYAAYVYYRSKGWVVRPGLALGGVDFLLYAQGPEHRHASFGVLIDSFNDPKLTCADVASHLRVVHSVGKRLILCRVTLPDLQEYLDCPWNSVRKATVAETLIDHWTPGGKS